MNYTLIAVATIAQFILGGLWYSPLIFGKWWMQIVGADNCTPEEIKAMQKGMGPFYLIQLVITFVSTTALAMFIQAMPDYSAYMTAAVIFGGFMLPLQISGVIWGGTKRALQGKQLLVLALGQFLGMMLAAWILSM